MSVVKNLLIRRDGFNLDIPNFEILDQGLHILSGASGSGKSTLLNTLLGLTGDQKYSWEFEGIDLAKLPIAERRIGIVFQNLGLFPHMSGTENIEFVVKARKLDLQTSRKQIQEWSKFLNMEKFLDRKVNVLSGGEKQRIAFIRALISDPRIIFLDEPFSSLDVDLKKQGRQILSDIKKIVKVPILMVSHDPEDATILADKVTRIVDGKIIS